MEVKYSDFFKGGSKFMTWVYILETKDQLSILSSQREIATLTFPI